MGEFNGYCLYALVSFCGGPSGQGQQMDVWFYEEPEHRFPRVPQGLWMIIPLDRSS